jgi:hypothetical protein
MIAAVLSGRSGWLLSDGGACSSNASSHASSGRYLLVLLL